MQHVYTTARIQLAEGGKVVAHDPGNVARLSDADAEYFLSRNAVRPATEAEIAVYEMIHPTPVAVVEAPAPVVEPEKPAPVPVAEAPKAKEAAKKASVL